MSERREVRGWVARWPSVDPGDGRAYFLVFRIGKPKEDQSVVIRHADDDAALLEELATLRGVLESEFPAEEGFGEAFDALVEAGLLVEVPADEEYRDQWESETMWVWRWRRDPGRPEGEK